MLDSCRYKTDSCSAISGTPVRSESAAPHFSISHLFIFLPALVWVGYGASYYVYYYAPGD
eukprot:COSAG02_NODE_23713_length_710_cov_1.083470_1_plen_59_part_10